MKANVFRATSCTVGAMLLALGPALATAPSAGAVNPPVIDPGALPADGDPTPPEPMKQGAYCPRVGTLPDTDYRVQPRYMDMLDLVRIGTIVSASDRSTRKLQSTAVQSQ